MLAVDKPEESPGLTGRTLHQVANNVSGKSKGSEKFVLLWSYSKFYGAKATFGIPSSPLSVFTPYSPGLSALFSHLLFLMLGNDTVRRPRLIRVHPWGGRMQLLGLYHTILMQ